MKNQKLQNALQKFNNAEQSPENSNIELISTEEAFKVVGGNNVDEVELAPDCGIWGGSCGTWSGKCGQWS